MRVRTSETVAFARGDYGTARVEVSPAGSCENTAAGAQDAKAGACAAGMCMRMWTLR